ncbi:MAG: ferrous iron transport protein B, partial [Bacteroidetes bacterium]
CTQIIDLGLPVVLAVNMADLMEKQQSRLDTDRLSAMLGIPVVAISARKAHGLQALKKAISDQIQASSRRFLHIPPQFQPRIEQAKAKLNTQSDYLAYQALLRPAEFGLNGQHGLMPIEGAEGLIRNELLVRYDHIDNILSDVLVRQTADVPRLTRLLDRVLIHKVWGYAVFVAILFLIFQALFSWASIPMDFIDQAFAHAGAWMEASLPAGFLTDLWINGIWAGLGGIVIFIPQIAFLFFFIAILEESGYMSRVVFLMDRIMRPFGFSGKSVIPLVGGLACAIPSIMMTRNISQRKERLITIMVTPLMSCSARIPVYVLLIAMFVPQQQVLGIFNLQGVAMMGFYLLGFVMALASAFVFKWVLRYRSRGIFLTELPIYRMPRWRNVGLEMYQKSRAFVLEAGKVILVISVILWLMASFAPGNRFEEIDRAYDARLSEQQLTAEAVAQLEHARSSDKLRASYAGIAGQWLEPVIKPLGFDWKIGISLITSFAAREVFVGTMATIYSLGEADEENPVGLRQKMMAEKDPQTGEAVYSPAVALSLLIFYAFAMQCMSTLAVTKKETQSWKWPIIMLTYLTTLAYTASFVVYQLMT